MFYAGGMQYVLMVPLLLTVGIPLFIWSRKDQIAAGDKEPIFLEREKLYLAALIVLDIIAIYLVCSGTVSFG